MNASTRILLTVALGLSGGVDASAEPPPFKLTRFDEDYTYLGRASESSDFNDRLKFIRLGDTAYLSVGGEWRERFDSLDAARFGVGGSSDKYVLQRLLLHADLHVNDRLRAFVQFGRADAFTKTSPLGPSDANLLDLQNGFVDIVPDADRHLTLRAGRQEITLNSTQRFVSVREGPNVRQSFDGLRVLWDAEAWHLDGFVTRPVTYKPGSFDDAPDRRQRFAGIHVRYAASTTQSLEGYVLQLDRAEARFSTVTGDERRRSLGLRWSGTEGQLDQDIEGIYQWGTFAGRDIRAWAFGTTVGYTLAEPWKPRVALELDAGSGDRNPGDGRLQTFNPMFPKGAYFNESGLTSWSNLILIRGSVSVQPMPRIRISASLSEQWRQTGSDAVYLQPYTAIASTVPNAERRVGEAYQLDATWYANRYVTVSAQALHQSAGPAIRRAGGRSVNFGTVVVQLRF